MRLLVLGHSAPSRSRRRTSVYDGSIHEDRYHVLFVHLLLVLADLYQRLLLMDLEFALDKKVETDLWNVSFKNVIDNFQGTTIRLFFGTDDLVV